MGILLRSDSRLIAQVLRGRNEKFEPLVHRYLPAVRAVAYTRLRNLADVDDAAQETFLNAYEKLGDLREPDRFGPWLMTIARRVAGRVSNRRGQETPLSPELAEQLPAKSPDVCEREVWSLVRRHLDELPETAREVLVLHYFAGHGTREIARLLEITQSAVLKRLQRAREQLGASLVESLAGSSERSGNVGKQAARISAIATASGLYSSGTGSTAAAASSVSILFKGSAAIAVAALITAGASFFALTVPSNHSESVTVTPAAEPALSAGTAEQGPEARQPQMLVAQVSTSTPEPVEQAPEAESSATTDAEHVEMLDATEPKSLTGLWSLRIGDDESGVLIDYGNVVMTQTGVLVDAVLADAKGDVISSATGTLSGTRLSMEMHAEGMVFTPEGDVAADWDGIVLRADAPPLDTEFPSGTIRFELERLDEAGTDQHALEAATRDEVQAMFDALRAWRAQHGGVYPDPNTAKEVYLAVLPDDDTRRQIAYAPVPVALVYPPDLPRAEELAADTRFYPDLPLPDRLVRLEGELKSRWNGGVATLLKPVLEVRYPDHRIAFHATDADGVVEVRWSDDEEIPVAQHAALRASCANNMKQVGLASKMFENAASGYAPPGFDTLYPEFLADPRILRCPTKSGALLSYEILFPAHAHEYLLAIEADYLGVPIEDFAATNHGLGEIPYMIENHDCAGRADQGLRNVLFLDGHVEVMKPADFEARITPFLDYQ